MKARIDTAGHYARWDVTRLLVNPEHYGPFVAPSALESPDGKLWREAGELSEFPAEDSTLSAKNSNE